METQSKRPMSLSKAWGYYIVTSVFMIALTVILINLVPAGGLIVFILIAFHIAVGANLNIKVLRRLIEWHEMYNTVNNVAGAKIRMIIFWPLAYPILYLKLAAAKFL